jgi:hypothetical protein
MRRERLTYPGDFHHVMNRGINGETIFPGDKDKEVFLEIIFKRVSIPKSHAMRSKVNAGK